jgi:hypothetical protein
MDGSIPGDMGRGAIELPGKSEVVRFGKGTTWFAFADGGRLELEAAEASFRLTDSGRHLEDFHEDGPSRER